MSCVGSKTQRVHSQEKRSIRKKKHREHLKQLLSLNETINTVLILKDKFKYVRYYRSRTWDSKALNEWCLLAITVKLYMCENIYSYA